MKTFQKKLHFIILFGLFLSISTIYSQTSNEVATYKWFDKNLGIESLDFKNGSAHLNFDQTDDNQNRYYFSDNFRIGSLTYNDQNYFDLALKYDIYTDELVVKPYNESNTTKINIVKENVSSFKIGNEKFVNLKEINTQIFKGGYYEEIVTDNTTVLYIKHYKERKKILKENVTLLQFLPQYEFILFKENKFISINNKKEIIQLYPNQKRKINDFYFQNKELRKENPSLFMKNIMKYINNLNQ